MRGVLLLLLASTLALPASAKVADMTPVTVDQVEQMLASLHGKPDAKAAQQLSTLELTQRLSAPRLARLQADLPGPKTRQQLIALADASAFFDLPANEVPNTPIPDPAAQSALLARAQDFVLATLPRVPNFFATRETTRFEDSPAIDQPSPPALTGLGVVPAYVSGGQPPPSHSAPEHLQESAYQPLHVVGHSSVTVFVRDHREFVDPGAAKGKQPQTPDHGLSTAGEFGPILVTWLVDSMKGQVAWSHWEQDAAGARAVFRYSVPLKASHYTVIFPGGGKNTQYVSAYHGEIAVNPADGTILRLTMVADMQPDALVRRSDIVVEYGPVQIGGVTYNCPVKSVAVSLVRYLPSVAVNWSSSDLASLKQVLLQVNDVVFTQYHLFRAETRVLPVDSQNSEANPPPASATPAPAPSNPPRP